MNLLRSIHENEKNVILIIDPDDGAIVDASRAACSFYGYTFPELTSLSIDKIYTAPREKVMKEFLCSVMEGGGSYTYDQHLANGEVRRMASTTGVVSCSGTTYFYSFLQEDPAPQPEAAARDFTMNEQDARIHEMDHQVRNNLQLIESMISLYLGRDAGREQEVRRLQSKIRAIAAAYEFSTGKGPAEGLSASTFLKAISENTLSCRRQGKVSLSTRCDPDLSLRLDQAVSLGIVVDSALGAAIERGDATGRVSVAVDAKRSGESFELRIVDDTLGPPDSGDCIDAAIAKAAGAQLGAELETRSLPSGGIEFRCSFRFRDGR